MRPTFYYTPNIAWCSCLLLFARNIHLHSTELRLVSFPPGFEKSFVTLCDRKTRRQCFVKCVFTVIKKVNNSLLSHCAILFLSLNVPINVCKNSKSQTIDFQVSVILRAYRALHSRAVGIWHHAALKCLFRFGKRMTSNWNLLEVYLCILLVMLPNSSFDIRKKK